MSPEELRAKADQLEKRAAQLDAAASRASDNAPGWTVTGRSGRTARQDRATERALETTVTNAVKCVALRRKAKELRRQAAHLEWLESGGRDLQAQWKAEDKARVLAEKQERRRTLREGNLRDRIFVGCYPEGMVYADKLVELHGDYRGLAFLSYRLLKLTVYDECPGYLVPVVCEMAQEIIDRRGERFQVAGCSDPGYENYAQYMILGSGIKNNELHFPGVDIIIQSCDVDWANIGVFTSKKNAWCHVSIPDLERKYKKWYIVDLSREDFDRIIAEHREAILSTVEALNFERGIC